MVNDARSASTSPVLEMHAIDKSFVGVHALQGAHLRLFPGEVHAVMGQNGAGKSTLIKVLTGVYPADAGTIRLTGREIRPDSPQAAQALGIATVYQEVNLCPNLSVAENILAGRMPRRWGWIDWPAVRRLARASLEQLQIDADPDRILGEYPIAVQQMVAITRAVGMDARILVLDEPTSSLDEVETGRLFALMRRLKERGVAILFITHFLDQTYAISDRITVLQNGLFCGEYRTAELPKLELIAKMLGKELSEFSYATEHAARKKEATTERKAPDLLRVRHLGLRGSIAPFDLELGEGEVLGLAGLLGSGRTEMAKLIFGIDSADQGEVEVKGKKANIGSPRAAMKFGMGFCSEDRKNEGVFGELTVRENIVLALQVRRGMLKSIPYAKQLEIADELIASLKIKTPSAENVAFQLSGGNLQKVMLARWLATHPTVLILDEPTRGIDVGAKLEIMELILNLSKQGMGVIFISSEFEEVARCSGRIAVLKDHAKIGELSGQDVDERKIVRTIAEGG